MSTMVITGASSGIGRALAVRAARAGYDVIAVGRNREALETLRAALDAEGARVAVAAYDIADPSNARAIARLAVETFGGVDVLVNNAGHTATGPLSAQSDDALRAQFGTHAIGPVALVRETLPMLRAARGHVFLVGSGVARVPVPGLGAYPPSKAATRSIASLLRRELKPDGIAVTYVDPGVVDTPFMTRAGMQGAPGALLVAPEEVARKMLLAVRTRPRVLNAVPWQTAFVALAEALPRVTDTVLERFPSLLGAQELPAAPLPPAATPLAALAEPPRDDAARDASPSGAFDAALEPVRRRMERVKLRDDFVRGLLHDGDVLDVHEVALRWAGMPNKNERAVTVEVLDALTSAGYLDRDGERYRVLREPD